MINFGNFIVFDLHKLVAKQFAVTVQDILTSTVSLNHELSKISEQAVQWKISFNPDPCKQAQDLLFRQKNKFHATPIIIFYCQPYSPSSKSTCVCS